MSLPLAIHHRLDLIAEAARDVDATRAEIIAMLIAKAPLEAERLEAEILRYRKLLVGDVVPTPQPELSEVEPSEEPDNVVSSAKRGPGRPGRRGPD